MSKNHALKRPRLPGSLGGRLLLFIGMAILLVAVLQGAFAYRNALEQTDTLFDYQMQQTAFALRAGLPVDASGRPEGTSPEDENNEFIVKVWTNEGLRIFESAFGAALPQMAVLGFAAGMLFPDAAQQLLDRGGRVSRFNSRFGALGTLGKK